MKQKLFQLILVMFVGVLVGMSITTVEGTGDPAVSKGFSVASAAESYPRAPLGNVFTYQGRLTEGSGPASGQYDFIFSLFDAASGGTQVGTQTLTNQTVSDGLFTVALDFGANAFGGEARWLQISVRVAGGPSYTNLAPRVALTPTPYAMLANTTSSFNGWERDESSTSNPTISFQSTLLPQHGYAQHIVTADEVGLTYFDHTVTFPTPYRTGTIPTVTFTLTGQSPFAIDVLKGGTTNGFGDNYGRLFSVSNTSFRIRSIARNTSSVGLREGFHWIALGQR